MTNGWIGVDFDGTLSKYYGWGNPANGAPVQRIVDLVKQNLANGMEVRVLTARVSKDLPPEELETTVREVQDWCETHIGARLPVTAEKDFSMLCLIDDRCLPVRVNGDAFRVCPGCHSASPTWREVTLNNGPVFDECVDCGTRIRK